MSESKHTPIRWFVGQLESFEEVRRTVYEGDAFRNKTVAVFKTPEHARLAAAAPDMMDMLRECRATFAFAADDGDTEANAFIAEIDAVLAKAEGR